jgi:hypothetical protein
MESQFDDVMRKRTDIELIKIVTGPPADYQPEAFNVARREYYRRNLSEAELAIAQQEIQYTRAVDEAKANTPLETIYKILAFIFPGILLLMLSGLFKADGYDRKAKEMVRWTLYGFGFYVGLVVLIFLLTAIF